MGLLFSPHLTLHCLSENGSSHCRWCPAQRRQDHILRSLALEYQHGIYSSKTGQQGRLHMLLHPHSEALFFLVPLHWVVFLQESVIHHWQREVPPSEENVPGLSFAWGPCFPSSGCLLSSHLCFTYSRFSTVGKAQFKEEIGGIPWFLWLEKSGRKEFQRKKLVSPNHFGNI